MAGRVIGDGRLLSSLRVDAILLPVLHPRAAAFVVKGCAVAGIGYPMPCRLGCFEKSHPAAEGIQSAGSVYRVAGVFILFPF